MREFQHALQFIEACDTSKSILELRERLASALAAFGIPCFSLVAMLPSTPGGARAPTVLISTTVNGWSDFYWQENAFNYDPTVHASLRRYTAFSWSDIEARRQSKSASDLFSQIREVMSVDGGLVIPLHDERGFSGMIGLYQDDRELSLEVRRAVKLMAIYALERAKELHQEIKADIEALCPLTHRQRELLAFAAAGKSDWDIAHILGISNHTANDHFEKAKQAMGVRTRAQAIAIAVRQGWIVL
jgi:LuxR family quorum sensing-dependent transcriptional regulator